jgi:hypothetical protein
MSFTLVASGKAETAKGEAKYFEFAANNLKASDYPHLPSTKYGKGDAAKDVPVIKISPAAILVREYLSLADAKSAAEDSGITADRFEAVVLDLINTAERNETVRIVRSRVTDAKVLPSDLADFMRDAATEVNIFAEAERGTREGAKVKLEKITELAESLKNDPDALVRAIMAQLGINR